MRAGIWKRMDGSQDGVTGADELRMATSQVALCLYLATSARRFNYGRDGVAAILSLQEQPWLFIGHVITVGFFFFGLRAHEYFL